MPVTKRSEVLREFLTLAEQAKKEYQAAKEAVDQEDKLTQDMLHQLELAPLSYSQRCKLMTRLRACRRDRRYYKDLMEETESLATFFEDSQHKKTLEGLKQVLGKMRKTEQYHANRSYRPKAREVFSVEKKEAGP